MSYTINMLGVSLVDSEHFGHGAPVKVVELVYSYRQQRQAPPLFDDANASQLPLAFVSCVGGGRLALRVSTSKAFHTK